MNRPLPPLKALPIFIAAAETESFAQAAEQQHVTLSAVSQQIKLLEQDLQCQLFNRIHNGVRLTEHGKQLLNDIKPALQQIEYAKAHLIQRSNTNITISLLNSLATFWLIPKLPDFYQQHPDIDIRLSTNWSLPIAQQTDIDLIIGYGQKDSWPDQKIQHLYDDQLIAVCHPKLANIHHTKLASIIDNYKLLAIDDIGFRQYDWPAWCKYHDISQPKRQKFMQFSNTAQAIQACLNQVGILVTHKIFVDDLLKSSQLTLLGQTMNNYPWGYYLIFRQSQPSQALQNFCQWLQGR